MMRGLIRLLLVLLLPLTIHGNHQDTTNLTRMNHWVDSVYSVLSPAQRVAQLMVIRAWSCRDSAYTDSLSSVVARFSPGGICFFKGTPLQQALLTNRLQDSARIPLLIMMDAEWGLGMRLDSAEAYPRNMTLGALRNDSLIYQMASMIGKDCRRLGVHVNLAPVVDVNNNPDNPVIGFRSFGENPNQVAKKSMFYLMGLRQQGILGTAKHFPGHGDTDADSHLSLPLIPFSRSRMDSIELVPFREMIHDSVWGIMIAHLFVPELDSTPNQASTLSPAIIKGLLRKDLGFTGFVVSDALDMKGVAQFYKPGEIELKSFMAGNDILLLPQNLDIAVSSFTTVADSILIPNLVLESHVKKILRLKYQLGLTHRRPVDKAGIYSDLFRSESEVIQREIYQEAITLVRDPFGLIPLRYLDRRRIASLAIGDSLVNKFQERLSSYATTDHYHLPASFTKREADSMVFTLNSYDVVILGLFSTQSKPDQRFGVTPELEALIDTLGKLHRTILVVLGTPYALHVLDQEQLPE